MVASEDAMPNPISNSNFYESGIWILSILCCAYALPSTAIADSINSEQIRFPVTQTVVSPLNIAVINNSLLNVIQSRFGWSQGKQTLLADISQKSLRYPPASRNSSLTTLMNINRWAKRNRKTNSVFRVGENVRYYPDLLQLIWMMDNSSAELGRVYQKRIVRPYDKKVFVYGKDDRLRIYPSLLRKFPYSNIVRLSTGCTGTLVTPQHVLTAAHCVHTGVDFRNNLEMLKVEIPDSMGVRAYYVEKIGIPGRWLQPRSIHEHQTSWDYAVVKLSYSVHGRSQFFPLAVPTAGVLNENLQFLGFHNNRDDLWLSICPAKSNKAMVDGNLIITRCDSAVGNSGAAVLSDDSREGKKIIGVLSSTMPVGRMPYYTQFSIITALTWAKLHDICTEIGEIGVKHRVCPPLESIPRPRRYQLSNVIPFFG